MAGSSATSNGATEKHLIKAENGKNGWLSKKTQFTRRWKPVWFQIKDSKLFYGETEKNPVKSISLVGAEIEALEKDGGLGWIIRPHGGKRSFFFRAESAEEQQQWMEAICEAQMSSGERTANACVVQ
ncbi:Pleckstrin homology domain-containing family A member 6 [Bagarius yarrelli]|uniref:Pleckstrin homology domain-containing family A member 6 n=1 Tax=Bagarius yarrelli TaxID=175774 RepID=A0A556UYE3_BAGYA|nr:Pleckstrin homology domain-containing family A member 6 [Bagarius yarrelli]